MTLVAGSECLVKKRVLFATTITTLHWVLLAHMTRQTVHTDNQIHHNTTVRRNVKIQDRFSNRLYKIDTIDQTNVKVETKWNIFANKSDNISHMKLKSKQLLKEISTKCHDTRYKVPNIVHYIWFGCKRAFNFYHYLSVLSALSNMGPCAVVVHADCQPNSHWWRKIMEEKFNNVYVVYQDAPDTIFNKTINRIEHKADVVRLQILMKWGGIYLDDTVLVVRSFNGLRNYSTVFPYQENGILNNGIILSEPNSTFVTTLYKESYSRYKQSAWAYNSCRYPWMLWKQRPELDLYVEMEGFQPKWNEWRKVFYGNYAWHDNYAIHFFTKRIKRHINYPEAVLHMNSTFGEIARKTLYNITTQIIV